MAGIYLHVPYCRQACTYCDFYFSTNRKSLPDFVRALLVEMALEAGFFGAGTVVQSVYFGGGTPSLLPVDALAEILARLRTLFRIDPAAEITLEANPDDLSPEVLAAWHRLGVNRLSIGLQTLDDAQLRRLNRAHNAAQARAAVPLARAAGFTNLSVDLMYHLPGLDNRAWAETLTEVLAWQVPHLSAYGLTVEPRTRLAHQVAAGQVAAPDEAAFLAHFRTLQAMATAAGYEHYEVSNLALPGFRSRHNTSYWTGAAYLGLGPAAHGFDGDRTRVAKLPNVHAYTQALLHGRQLPLAATEVLSPEAQLNERLLTGLRRAEGFSLADLPQDLLPAWQAENAAALRRMQNEGLLVAEADRFRIPPAGFPMADAVARDLMLPNADA